MPNSFALIEYLRFRQCCRSEGTKMKRLILILTMTFNGVAFATDYPNCKNETKTTPDNDPYNKMVLNAARSMPVRKGYDITNDVAVIENLKSSVTVQNGKIHADAVKAGVGVCT